MAVKKPTLKCLMRRTSMSRNDSVRFEDTNSGRRQRIEYNSTRHIVR